MARAREAVAEDLQRTLVGKVGLLHHVLEQ
jgi:hypothetical protein